MALADLSALQTLRLMEALAGVGVLIASLEALYRQRRGAEPPLTTWEVMRSRHPLLAVGRWAPLYEAIANDRGVTVALWLRTLCALGLIGGIPPAPVLGACGLLAAAGMTVAAIRSPYGLDGADQMMLLTLAAVGLARFGGPLAHEAAIAFVALQAALSYCVAGLAKVRSADWRAGTALPGLLSTTIYGHRTVSRLLRRSPVLARGLSAFGMIWETLFPMALVAPRALSALWLAFGLGFHLSCAALMHLNTFLWAFAAAYPAVWRVNGHAHAWLRRLVE